MRSVSKPLLPWFRFSRSLNWTLEEPTIWPVPPTSPTFHPPRTLTVSSGETAHQIWYFGALTLPGVPLLTGHPKLGRARGHMAHGCYRTPSPPCSLSACSRGGTWCRVYRASPPLRSMSLVTVPSPPRSCCHFLTTGAARPTTIKPREAKSAEKQFKWHLSPAQPLCQTSPGPVLSH